MTHSEAFTAVENALSSLGLRNKWGEEMPGLLSLPPVARLHGKEWDQIEDALEEGGISPDSFAQSAIIMIEKFRFRRNLEKKLTNLLGHESLTQNSGETE